MTNIELMEKALPTAPLKILPWKAARIWQKKWISTSYRSAKILCMIFWILQSIHLMKQILILQRTVAHVLVRGKQRECLAKVSAEKISLLWWMSATTA